MLSPSSNDHESFSEYLSPFILQRSCPAYTSLSTWILFLMPMESPFLRILLQPSTWISLSDNCCSLSRYLFSFQIKCRFLKFFLLLPLLHSPADCSSLSLQLHYSFGKSLMSTFESLLIHPLDCYPDNYHSLSCYLFSNLQSELLIFESPLSLIAFPG